MAIQYQLSYLFAETCSAQLFASVQCRAYEGDNERSLTYEAERVSNFEDREIRTVEGLEAGWEERD